MSSANVTLSILQWQNKAFKITGTLTANVLLILPVSTNGVGGTAGVGGELVVDNQTTGAFTITVLTAATGSTGVVAQQGARRLLYSDTVNVFYADSPIPNVSLGSMAGWTRKGNNTSGSAATQDFTIDALTFKASPTNLDEVSIWDAASPSMKKANIDGIRTAIASAAAPTVQRFTSGSGTYTPTAGIVRARIRMCGGGGGGGATVTNNGANGGDTSFGTWTASHGNGGAAAGGASSPGGTGGVNGTGTLIARFDGGRGEGGMTG